MPAALHTYSSARACMVIFQYGRHKSLHRCPPTFSEAIWLVKRRFKIATEDDVELCIDAGILGVVGDVGEVALASDSWDALFQSSRAPVVTVRTYNSQPVCKTQPCDSEQQLLISLPLRSPYSLSIYIYYNSDCFTLQILDSLTMWDICCTMAHWLGLDAELLIVYQHGRRLSRRETVLGAGIRQHDVLWLA